jgi:hypothetical protein
MVVDQPPVVVVEDAPQDPLSFDLGDILHLHHTLQQIKAKEDKSQEKAATKRLRQHNKNVFKRRQLEKEKLNATAVVPALLPLPANLKTSPFLIFLMFVGFLLAQNTANMPLWGQLLICCAIYCSYTYAGTIAEILEITQVACQDIKSAMNRRGPHVSKEAKEAVPVSKGPYMAKVGGLTPASVIPVRPDLSYNISAFEKFSPVDTSVEVNAEDLPKNIRDDTDCHSGLKSEQLCNNLITKSGLQPARSLPEIFQPLLLSALKIDNFSLEKVVFHETKEPIVLEKALQTVNKEPTLKILPGPIFNFTVKKQSLCISFNTNKGESTEAVLGPSFSPHILSLTKETFGNKAWLQACFFVNKVRSLGIRWKMRFIFGFSVKN